nr:MAG TPA: hypothetical protein [Caudoviricetes sp.]
MILIPLYTSVFLKSSLLFHFFRNFFLFLFVCVRKK